MEGWARRRTKKGGDEPIRKGPKRSSDNQIEGHRRTNREMSGGGGGGGKRGLKERNIRYLHQEVKRDVYSTRQCFVSRSGLDPEPNGLAIQADQKCPQNMKKN